MTLILKKILVFSQDLDILRECCDTLESLFWLIIGEESQLFIWGTLDGGFFSFLKKRFAPFPFSLRILTDKNREQFFFLYVCIDFVALHPIHFPFLVLL